MDIKLQKIDDQPLIRINIFKRQSHLDLKYPVQDFELHTTTGKRLFESVEHNGYWRIKVKKAEPRRYDYYLILREAEKRTSLEEDLKTFRNVMLQHVGGRVILNDKPITKNDKYMLIAGPFASEREARHHSQDYAQMSHCRIYRQIAEEGKGSIEIFDPQYEHFTEVRDGIVLEPKNRDSFYELRHFKIHTSSEAHYQQKNLHYRGRLLITIDENNTLLGVSEIGVEDYLAGVLLSELPEKPPVEFAKSMAVVARSQVFARLGQMHAQEGFDFCSDSHCLRYYGRGEVTPEIETTLSETHGMILTTDTHVCNAYFSYSCGGHTENASGVWYNVDSDYMTGKYDMDEADAPALDLTQDMDVEQWILDRPEVLCKTSTSGCDDELACDAFRWELFYTRQELEEIIYEKTGEELGTIYELIPVSRGVSGRIRELEILGSLKNVRIRGEMNIRSALSETLLNSSCFMVRKEMDMDGVPLNFTFIGAGKGHGVGLCKVGASRMAAKQKDFRDILAHYFEKCEIKRIY